MRILVTGGAGFIGNHFIRHMLKKYTQYEIINLDKLTYCGNLNNTLDFRKNKNYKFIRGDICNKNLVERISKNVNAIVNFAAESITADTFIPVHTIKGIKTLTLEKMWENQERQHQIIKTEKGEAIFLNNHNVKVLSFLNGARWMPLRAITRHWYEGKIIKLKQKFGIIKVTPNHSIYSSKLELSNPTINPELLVVRTFDGKKHCKKVQKELLEFLAAYVTEGNLTFNKANGGYIVEIGQKDKKWLKNIGLRAKKLFGVGYNICLNKSWNGYRLQISNKKLFEHLEKVCGKGATNKKFPDWVFDLEPNLQEFFWNKLLEGDGSREYNDRSRYSTVSYYLANQISLLLTLLKRNFIISERKFKNKGWSTAYEFRIGYPTHHGLNKKIKEEIFYKGWVYDIEVDRTHNFICGLGNAVCHNTHVDRSIIDAGTFVKTDVFGTYSLLEAARKNDVKKIVHISTDETYGSIKKGSFGEDDPLSPSSPYSASKAGADMLVTAYRRTYGMPTVITRSSNNYGPYQFPEKIIPLFITNLLEGKKVPVYGDGLNVRDWLFVNDNCTAIDLILHKGEIGEIYNIASSDERTNMQMTRMLLGMLGKSEEMIQFVEDRKGHDFRYSMKSRKIRKLGWTPRVSLETGLRKTVEWYRDNVQWWKPLKR